MPTLELDPPRASDTPMRKLIPALKAADQDHEFYPTTDEIIRALIRDIKNETDTHYRRGGSMLDIGAGNGKVLQAVKDADVGIQDLLAIEKSQILCQEMNPDILIVGTEFQEQSLLSKPVDVIFCNPPYREFETWAEKIIRQSPAPSVYLVIPERWEKSIPISDALRFRDTKAKKIGSFDFQDSEDRQARAKVQLIRIDFEARNTEDDAFEKFFKEQFADLIAKFNPETKTKPAHSTGNEDGSVRKAHRPFHALVVGPSYPEAMVNIYGLEMANVEKNYRLVGGLDPDLLKEFDISPTKIMGCLKQRLSGLRNDYWNELFSHLSTIIERLTSGSRNKLLATLQRHVQVDFTLDNIFAVVIWVIKNANCYIDAQLLSTYELLVDKCNVKLYKSNKRTWEDERWRYNDAPSKNTHYALDYRIVTHKAGGCQDGKTSWHKGLEERAAVLLGDLITLGNNLGFRAEHSSVDLERSEWTPGALREFYYTDKEGKTITLFDVRAFKNGNLHLRFNQKFILALNVEHGRLRGWINSASEAVEELGDVAAADYFRANIQLQGGNPTLLLT